MCMHDGVQQEYSRYMYKVSQCYSCRCFRELCTMSTRVYAVLVTYSVHYLPNRAYSSVQFYRVLPS